MDKEMKIVKSRFLNWLYAFIFGYFWLPCPLCGKNFGGHESHGMLMTSYGGGVCVCYNCKEIAEKLNKENNYFMPEYLIP